METLPALLAICEGYPPIADGFPHERSVMRFDISLLLARTNCWPNTRVPGGLKRHDAHVMSL